MNCQRRSLVLAAFAWPFAASGQQPKKMYRIGYLSTGPRIEAHDEAFRQRLAELGYVDGKNTVIEWRFYQGIQDRAPGLAAELVGLKVDCIAANGVSSVRAAIEASKTIPIVMLTIDADPVEMGFIKSLARPGGNVTGFTAIGYELAGKRLELLKELVPKATRAAALADSRGTRDAQRAHLKGTEDVASKLGLQLQVIWISGPEELEGTAFRAARDGRAEILSVISTGWMNSHRDRIVDFVAKTRLPAIYPNPIFLPLGGLMSYSADRVHQWRETASYVARILSGTKPTDLPVQQPTKFELAINMRTVKSLGLTVPPPIMVRADRVIE